MGGIPEVGVESLTVGCWVHKRRPTFQSHLNPMQHACMHTRTRARMHVHVHISEGHEGRDDERLARARIYF